MPNYYPKFAELLEQYLQQAQRNPTWLAMQLGLNSSTVVRWLNHKTRPRNPDLVARILKVLDITDGAKRQALFKAADFLPLESLPPVVPEAVPVPVNPHAPFMTPPLPAQGIVGRDDFLAQMEAGLHLKDAMARDVPPLALVGMGGIGKTTLAIAFGRQSQMKAWFPDGVLWTAVGTTPTIRLLLEQWGRALGLDLLPERDEQACMARLQTALARKRALLLIDDVWEVAHGNAFLVGGPHCRTIFTTREQKVALHLGTRSGMLTVDLLKPEAALELLRRLVPQEADLDDATALRLCEQLEYLPLALTLAGRYLANEAAVPARVQRLLGEFGERGRSLTLIQEDHTKPFPQSLQTILAMSVERLSPVDQARFAMASTFGGDPLTWDLPAAAFVWECSEAEAETTIVHLVQRSLIQPRGNRYWMHALLAQYAEVMLEDMGL